MNKQTEGQAQGETVEQFMKSLSRRAAMFNEKIRPHRHLTAIAEFGKLGMRNEADVTAICHNSRADFNERSETSSSQMMPGNGASRGLVQAS